MLVVVVRYETAATARWALLFIVRAFFNDTIAVAVWTGFHVRLMGCYHTPAIIFVGALRIGRLRNRLRQSLVANCSRSPKSFGSSNFTACPQLATFLAQATAEYRSSAREAAIRGDGRMPHCLVGASATGTPQICIQRAVDKAARRHGYLSMSALPPKADMCSALMHVRFVPIADIRENDMRETERPPRSGLSEIQSGAIKSVSPGTQTGRCKLQG